MGLELKGATLALYGRFLLHPRAALAREITARGGRVERDFTRASSLFVVGLGAIGLVASGGLTERLRAARARGVPIYGEERFLALLDGEDNARGAAHEATLPLGVALDGAGVDDEALALLAAFDVVRLERREGAEFCRFADAPTLRQAGALIGDGGDLVSVVKALRRARAAPPGRHRLVTGPDGEAALAWAGESEGLTTLEGQGFLPLDPGETLDEVFEAAALAEAEGDLASAERLYEICARADARDPIAPFNLANILAEKGETARAILSYRVAIARDLAFAEAHYNLAAAHEAREEWAEAEAALEAAVKADDDYADALFNLGQLKLRRSAYAEARPLFEAYLATEPPEDWAATAQRALTLIRAERPRAG